MFRVGLLAICACGRFGFDVEGDPNGGGDGGGNTADAYVRGDVSFTNNIAFVTDPIVTPGTLGSVTKADAACQSVAEAAGLPGTYVAWLSSSTSNAIDRISASRGWVRADGLPYFDMPGDLVAGRMLSPLVVTADGQPASFGSNNGVITGTRPNGTVGANCTDLTDPAALIDHGTATTVTADWTWYSYSWGMCDQPGRLYCLGVGSTQPVVVEPAPARRAFLSTTAWQPGGGLASADAVCQSDAATAGLSGASTFRALLATATATAASRFSDGLPWRRIDGMLVAGTAQALFAGDYRVPLSVFADGAYSTATGSGAVVWFGAPRPDAVGINTCQDWTSANNGVSGTLLNHVRINPGTASSGCGGMYRLFCLEP